MCREEYNIKGKTHEINVEKRGVSKKSCCESILQHDVKRVLHLVGLAFLPG